jgi:DNA-directed RNA polymerase specialized sigma24 family protein
VSRPSEDEFRAFVEQVEPKLHRALVAQLGWERGRDATAAAFGYAWEHWGELGTFTNPVGYLFRVGQSRTRNRKSPLVFERPSDPEQWYEPALAALLSELTESQRVSVILVHAYQWTTREVGDLLGLKPTTVQTHLARALRKLRSQLEVTNDA